MIIISRWLGYVQFQSRVNAMNYNVDWREDPWEISIILKLFNINKTHVHKFSSSKFSRLVR